MASKYKTTPFLRFLFAMIIIVPLAYFGASYYKGENPIENIKNGVQKKTESIPNTSASQTDLVDKQSEYIKQLESQIKEKDLEIKRLKNSN